MNDEMEAIVLDNGSGVVKAGFAGEDAPRTVFPSCAGTVKNPEWFAAQAKAELRDSFVGSECQQLRDFLDVVQPIVRGIVEDWDALERVWEHIFARELRVNPETTTLPILCTSSPAGPKQQQERMAQIMFESQKVCGFYYMQQCVLSLFASGRTRGIVVEIGHGSSHTVPIFEGYALPHAALQCGVGGVDISHRLHKLLTKRGHSFHSFQLQTIHDIKEAVCVMGNRHDAPRTPMGSNSQHHRVSHSDSSFSGITNNQATIAPGSSDDSNGSKAFELPDGTVLHVDQQTRTLPADVLFRPHELGDDHPLKPTKGLHEVVVESIEMCDKDLQRDLRSAVVLAGGTTMLPGFAKRFYDELSSAYTHSHSHASSSNNLRVVPDPHVRERGYNSQRKIAAWIGGSMLASLGTFRDIHITKQEWEEYHEAIIDRKCF